MKLRARLSLGVFLILLLGAISMIGWLYYSSTRNAVHQARESAIAFSDVMAEAVRTIMNTGEQSFLDQYLEHARVFDSVADIRVVRSAGMEKQLGVKAGSSAQDALDREVLASGKRISEPLVVNKQHALRVVSPFLAEQSCLSCHPGFKTGEVMAAVSVVLVYQHAVSAIVRGLFQNSVIQGLIILLVLGAIYLFFERYVMRPVSLIRNAVIRFGKGDWTATLDRLPGSKKKLPESLSADKSIDEIGELAVVFNNMGQNLKAVSVSRDLLNNENEARRRTEAELRESKERFDQLADQSRTISWEVDRQGLYTYVGHVSESVLGYRPDELVGKKYFFDLHPEDGREAFKKSTFAAIERREKFDGLVNPVLAKDGRIVWVSTVAIPVMNPDGSLKGYRGSDTDITARRDSEELMRKRSQELEVFYKASFGREERIIELKKEIARLRKELGQ